MSYQLSLLINKIKINYWKFNITLCGLITVILLNLFYTPNVLAKEAITTNYYRTQTFHHPDGIGKYYMDREIARVMGHQALMWLERDSREQEEKPQAVIEHLELQATDKVADIGTGTGYFALRIADLVPEGTVYAVDIQSEMLDVINAIQEKNQITNIKTILGTEDNPNLPPNSINLALMIDAYHEFAYPREMMEKIYEALKPGGKVVLVEYRQENPLIMIKPLHKMSQKQVKKEMKAVHLKWVKTQEFLPEQHFIVFQK